MTNNDDALAPPDDLATSSERDAWMRGFRSGYLAAASEADRLSWVAYEKGRLAEREASSQPRPEAGSHHLGADAGRSASTSYIAAGYTEQFIFRALEEMGPCRAKDMRRLAVRVGFDLKQSTLYAKLAEMSLAGRLVSLPKGKYRVR